MVRKKEGSKLLRAWVDKSQKGQAQWILDYLSKRNDQSALARYLMARSSQAEAQFSDAVFGGGRTFESVILEKIMDDHSSELVQSDPVSRELMRSMRGAWQQKQYRENTGKQITLQLPKELVLEADRIARDHGESRAHTLEQMIGDAANIYQSGSLRSERKVLRLEEKLKKEVANGKAGMAAFRRRVEFLQGLLVQEVLTCCDYEAFPPCGDEIDAALFDRVLEGKINHLEELMPDIDSRMLNVRSIKECFANGCRDSGEG